MKRLLACLLTLLLGATVFAGSSDTLTYTDSFSFLSNYPKYLELYEAINNNGSADEVEKAYANLKASLGNSANDWSVLLKASLNYAHYCLEMAEKKDSKKAKQLIANANAIYEALEKSGLKLAESRLKALKFACLSIGYLASPLNISLGLESVEVIDEAYEEYPNEVTIATLYAARKLNAPAIGGGDAEEAYEVFAGLVAYIDSDAGSRTLPWDKFDIYCGMAKCYAKKGETSSALVMYYKALSIYDKNDTVITEIGKLEKK